MMFMLQKSGVYMVEQCVSYTHMVIMYIIVGKKWPMPCFYTKANPGFYSTYALQHCKIEIPYV